MKWTAILMTLIIFTSCKKENNNSNLFTIEGRLLESTSNPIPVKNYDMRFYQTDGNVLLGLDTTVKTGNDGKFTYKYDGSRIEGTPGATNNILFSLRAGSLGPYPDVYPFWFFINTFQNLNLNNIYVFKKIDKLVIKVKFNIELEAGETMEVKTENAQIRVIKNIAGPIAVGTLLTVDSISNFKAEAFNYATQQYIYHCFIKTSIRNIPFNLYLPIGDESYRENILVYDRF